MASITDIVSAVQNWVTAESGLGKQLAGSFTNISGQLTALSSAVTAVSSASTANTAAIAAIQASYVRSIAGLSSDFTLGSTIGITNSSRTIVISAASSSQFGAVQVDGTTITSAGGVITAVSTGTSLTSLANSISSDVALNNTANYFDGPVVVQGSSGKWFVSGTVTLIDTAVLAAIYCKLWDGTTVIDSAAGLNNNLSRAFSVSLSGVITSPAGNLRISCRDVDGTTGKILANQTGNAKDSTITAIRIG